MPGAAPGGDLIVQGLGTDHADLERAASLLRAGELVAFPTETVYGLGADAANPEAAARIFATQQRPADHPLIVHLPDAQAIDAWARALPPTAHTLAEAFWAGPLTLIVLCASGVSDLVSGGQDSVGLRVPGHAVVADDTAAAPAIVATANHSAAATTRPPRPARCPTAPGYPYPAADCAAGGRVVHGQA